jgi:hypothetical protein
MAKQRATVDTYQRAFELRLEEHELVRHLENLRETRRELEERLKATLGTGRPVQRRSPPGAMAARPVPPRHTAKKAAPAKGRKRSPEADKVLGFIRAHAPKPVTVAAIRAQPGMSKGDPGRVSRILYRLKRAKLVRPAARGQWASA